MRRAENLTHTQQRVLELIAEGKTNFEISQALGLTIDGAKYHVSELFSKLGVDSREEAAAWWRSRRGHAAAIRQLPARAWIGSLVAVGTTAAVVIAGIAIFGDRGQEPTSPGPIPAIQAAFIEGGADGGAQRILVVDQDGVERQVGGQSRYGVVSWSPDGRNLMALEIGTRQRVWILNVVTGASVSWTEPDFQAYAWSPDSQHLAVLGGDAITVHEAHGKEVVVLKDAFFLLRTSQTLVPISWSPDSKLIVAGGQDTLEVLSLDGDRKTLDLPGGISEIGALFLDWRDSSRLAVLYVGAPSGAWTTDVAATVPEWEPIRPEDFKGPVERPQRERDQAQAAAGDSLRLHCASATAEGEGFASAFLTEDRRSVQAVVVQRDSGLIVIQAPAGVSPISLRPCVSVVIAR